MSTGPDTTGGLKAKMETLQVPIPLSGFVVESGAAYALTYASGVPALTRTTDQNSTDYVNIPIQHFLDKLTGKGWKLTALKACYSVGTADSGDDVQFQITYRTLPVNGAASTVTTLAGDADADYDADHDTAAERVVDTAGPELHTAVVSVPTGDQLYIVDDTHYHVRVEVIEADDATGALAVIITGLVATFARIL